ncbi:suppressor of SWI4 1 homolog isoform X3 [Phyllostomus discolor]|uniref:Suppressor of SWI4 1 homolog isoform X3 n=1 Tax=Phyllostomus discolor TaxID=89673 RepID=A0A6J2ME23_9CHIR|nr:suppressor of SWI4 1 homolog isoform X3 [Phyllostomus discolor]
MRQSGRSRYQKRARAQAQQRNLEAYAARPHSFVFARGRAGRGVRQLSLDLRRVMEPLTATRLQIRKKNSLKDCVAVAGPLGVTHFLILSKTETNIYFKLMRLPGGPTLTFRINKYTLVRDVVSSLRRHRMHEQQFTHPPLLVLNSFGPHGMHVKLMATMFQNLFPSINVHQVNLNTIKRCLLISYNPDSQDLDFRHYSIKVVPVGASRGMKKLLQEKFPNMSRLQDISELLATGAGLSESEAEPDGEHNITELPQAVAGRGNMRAQQSAVRLTEIGPRMTLQLIKIQEGVGEGNVLFHSFVHKTEEELQAILAAKEEKLRLKAQRQDQQAQNIQRKQERREAHRKKSLAGMKRARAEADGDSDAEDPGAPPEAEVAGQQEEEDEAEYFRQAVGEEPDEDMFPKAQRRRPTGPPRKKQRRWREDRGATRCPTNISAAADQILSSFQEVFLWPMLVTEFLVAMAGNSLALYRFSTQEQRPWSPAVVFSAQLAVSDLLYALTLPPLAAYFYPPKHWPYGEAACRLERFLFTCNLLGSITFITFISLNRYLGVVHPFFTRSHLQPKHAWIVSATGWVLVALLAAPTLSFSHLTTPWQEGNCTVARPEACIKCLGTTGDSQLEAYTAYSLVLGVLGCGLPLLLTLAAYSALGRAVLRSHGTTAAEKKHVAVLVASGVALYASSYVPYYVTRVVNIFARQRWRARCPDFVDVAQAVEALDLGSYVGHQVTRGLVPLAICIHPLLYMAVVPSVACHHQCCLGCREGQAPENAESCSQALPLTIPATKTSGPHYPELSP